MLFVGFLFYTLLMKLKDNLIIILIKKNILIHKGVLRYFDIEINWKYKFLLATYLHTYNIMFQY